MCKYQGFSVMTGVAIGPIHFYQRPARRYDMTPCEDSAAELERMEQARKQSIEHQSVLYAKALQEAGAEIAAVFDVHALMLDDKEFVETVRENIIDHHMRAEYAVRCAAYAMVDRFAGVEDEYLRARVDDILDMARGVIYLLQGDEDKPGWKEPAIVIAEDFTPSETVQMDKGFCDTSGQQYQPHFHSGPQHGFTGLGRCQGNKAGVGRHDCHSGRNCRRVDRIPGRRHAGEVSPNPKRN